MRFGAPEASDSYCCHEVQRTNQSHFCCSRAVVVDAVANRSSGGSESSPEYC